MAPKSLQRLQSVLDSKARWLIGLSILTILGLSVTVPILLLSLVRAGVILGDLITGSGFVMMVGLVGLASLFSLTLIYQHGRINALRRRTVQDQLELEQSKSRFAELTSLFQLGNSLHMDLPLQTMLDIAARRIASTLHAHDVDIFLFSKETRTLRCISSFGLARRAPEEEVAFGEGPIGWCARQRQGLLLTAGEKGSAFAGFLEGRAAAASALVLPMQSEKRCVGVILIARSSGSDPFRGEHRDVAQLFADNLGPVVQRAKAAAAARRDAMAAADAAPDAAVARAADAFQDGFLSSANLELKAPLTTIVAYSEVLDQNDPRMTPAMRSEFSGRVREAALGMAGVVDDVLDLVRLELGRYVLELNVGGVNEVVRSAVEAARPVAEAKKVTIQVNLDPAIPGQHVDQAKLRRSVLHLVQNAARFSPKGGHISVETKLTDGGIRIEVTDTGPIFDGEEAREIYEIEGITSGDRKRARHGFGLHLAKRFVELHGGSVGAEPIPDGGAMFWIQMPCADDLSQIVGADPFAEELARR